MPSKLPEIRLNSIPRLAQGGRWRVEAMRSNSDHLLLWFTRGQGRVTVAGTTRGYGAHNAIFIPSGKMHGFEVSSQVYGTAVFIPQSAALPLPEAPLHLRIRDAASQSQLTGILDSLQREIDGTLPDRVRATHHYAGLLAIWLRRQSLKQTDDVERPKTSEILTARYSDLIERDFRSSKTVADYAAILGVTPTHLSRVCNQACGRPASALITDRVHFEARMMLAETKTPIKDVAADLGFASAAYFTRAFQLHTGMTPSAFRSVS